MILLAAFVILLVRSGRPWLCIWLYIALDVVIGLLFWPGLLIFVGAVALSFAWAWAYFTVLDRMERAFFGWWAWMIGFPLAGGALEYLIAALLAPGAAD